MTWILGILGVALIVLGLMEIIPLILGVILGFVLVIIGVLFAGNAWTGPPR